ncbi:MAG: hypothetical protein ABII71_01555 [Candidatus Micrarchaeota archaeon]
MAGNTVEVCANCGKVNKKESKDFLCSECGCHVSVVIPRSIFLDLVKSGAAKE